MAFKYIFLAVFFFLFMFMMHYFSSQVHFHTNFWEGFKSSLFLTLKNPVISIGTTTAHVAIIFISMKVAPILIFFISGSLITYISFNVFYKVSLKSVTA